MAESDGEEASAAGVRVAGVLRWALIALMAAAAVGAWIGYARAQSRFAQSADQYQCPMHPAVLLDRPGECVICGMALVPVGHAPPRGSEKPAAAVVERLPGDPGGPVPGLVTVDIGPERTQLVGMRTAKVTRQRLTTQLRTVGFVSADDSSVAIATTRFSGWVEEVPVAQGQHVEKGEVLATLSGPELLTAQQVYLAARGWAAKQKGPGPGAAASSAEEENNALQRLGIAQRDIDRVARGNRPLPTMPIRAPISGHVARRNVLKGLYVQPGTELFQIVDLTRVWVVADVYEQHATRLQLGQGAQLFLAAHPGEAFSGKIDFIYPALDIGGRDALQLADKIQVLGDFHLRVERRSFGQVADAPFHLHGVFQHVKTGDVGRALRRRQEAGEDAHGGGLPGAVGAEEADDLAFFHLEGDVVHGDSASVSLG